MTIKEKGIELWLLSIAKNVLHRSPRMPILCKAVKERSGNTSDKDVVDYLESRAKEVLATATRDRLQSQIRLYLAGALITKDQLVRESSLKEIVRVCALNPGLEDDTERLFDGIARSMDDANLRSVVDAVHNHLSLLKGKPAGRLTQKS